MQIRIDRPQNKRWTYVIARIKNDFHILWERTMGEENKIETKKQTLHPHSQWACTVSAINISSDWAIILGEQKHICANDRPMDVSSNSIIVNSVWEKDIQLRMTCHWCHGRHGPLFAVNLLLLLHQPLIWITYTAPTHWANVCEHWTPTLHIQN